MANTGDSASSTTVPPASESGTNERWLATLIATRSQLAPETREEFDREHAEAIQARSAGLQRAN